MVFNRFSYYNIYIVFVFASFSLPRKYYIATFYVTTHFLLNDEEDLQVIYTAGELPPIGKF